VTGRHGVPRPGTDEADQLIRLAAFRAAHPDVVIGDGGFGTWQARVPQPNGETVITRYALAELLDELAGICPGGER
jgi:hypothetical protein